MKIFTPFFLLFFGSYSPLFAQNEITCASKYSADGKSVSIIATNSSQSIYSIKVTFSTLIGYSAYNVYGNKACVTVENREQEIITLRKTAVTENSNYSYRYTYSEGTALDKKPDTTFTYLLPTTPNNTLLTSKLIRMGSDLNLKKKVNDDYIGIVFNYELNDTICAARAGLVAKCSDEVKEGENITTTYTDKRNSIYIHHKDGTIARYNMTAPIELLVKTGDKVRAGQPIAILNKESEKYKAFFSVYYLDKEKFMSDKKEDRDEMYRQLYLQFYESEAKKGKDIEINKTYLTEHPLEIITAEMSKKEKKKFLSESNPAIKNK